jgi:hypothetical protein
MPPACPGDCSGSYYKQRFPIPPFPQRRRSRRWGHGSGRGGVIACSGKREAPPGKPGASKSVKSHSELQTYSIPFGASALWSGSYSSVTSCTVKAVIRSPGDLRQRWQKAGDLKALPWDVQAAAQETRKRMLADLNAYLKAGVPPESLVWTVHCRADANDGFPSGRFPIAVAADDERLELAVVLGDETPPAATEATGAPAGILRSLKIVYPLPKEKRVFCQPLAGLGWSLELGWLWVYLLTYLPLMFLTKWLARVP